MNVRFTLSLSTLAAACVLISSLLCTPTLAQFAPPFVPQPPASTPTKSQLPSPAVQKAMRQWEVALRFHKTNKLSDAVAAYNEFLRQVHTANLAASAALPAYQNLTAIYRSQGNIAGLQEALKQWAALAPDNPVLHAELASIYASPKVQKFDESVLEARKALKLKPSPQIAAGAHAAIGIAGVAKKDYAAAEQEFGAAIKLLPGNAQMTYNYGLALVERKKFAPALAAMKKAADLNPKMTGAWYYVGLLSETQQKYPESLKAFRKAVSLAPADPTIRFDLARVLVRTNDVEGAITSYLGVLETAPQSVPARIAVAQLYVQLRNYAAGRVHYSEAAKLAPKNAQVLVGLADCETELSRQPQDAAAHAKLLQQAEDHYRAAVAIDPKYLTGENSLARFYDRTGNFIKAQEIYRKRLDAAPNEYSNVNSLAQSYLMQRKPDEAIGVWRKYRDQHPENPAPYARAAETLQMQAKWLDAAAEWQLLLKQKLQPGSAASVMVSIGKDLARAGKNKEAIEQLQAVLQADTTAGAAPKEIRVAEVATIQAERLEAMQELAQIAERANDIDGAVHWQQQVKAEEAAFAARTHGTPNPSTYLTLARLYQRAKKPELAIQELDALTKTAQSRKENFGPAYEELAQVYESQNRFDEAILAYRQAAKFSQEPLNGRLRIAEVYQRSNRMPLAIAEFEAIKKDFPNESRVLAPLALAYRQAGRDEDAIRVYDTLLQTDPRATWARDQKAVVLTHLKRYDDARAMYQDQLVQNPQNRQLYADVAFVFQSEGKPDAFLDWALPRLEKSPANLTLMTVILDETIRQKKEDRGWEILRASYEKNKAKRPVAEATATLMAERGKKEDALALYRQVAGQFPNDLTAQLALADQLFVVGHKDEAAKMYTGLMARADLGPGEKLSVRRQFARCLLEQGNNAEALAQLQAIVKADSNDFDSATKLAQQLEAAGREMEAIPVLQNLAAREVYDATVRAQIHSKIGRLYLKKGDKTEAAAQFRKALELNPGDTAAQAGLAELAVK